MELELVAYEGCIQELIVSRGWSFVKLGKIVGFHQERFNDSVQVGTSTTVAHSVTHGSTESYVTLLPGWATHMGDERCMASCTRRV